MLYDPKWDQKTETKADPFSVAGLIAWLEQQPADGTYCFFSTGECLMANYLRAVTGKAQPTYHFTFSSVLGANWPYYQIAARLPFTYGAALERARALI